MTLFSLASWGDTAGPILNFVIGSLLVAGLAYGASRLIANWQVQQFKGRRLRVLEGAPVGKDRAVFLVAVGKQVLVLGSSPAGVNLISTVDDPAMVEELIAQPVAAPDTISTLLEGADARIRSSLSHMQQLLSNRRGRS